MPNQMVTYIFKLRGNIALEGDLALARMELEAFLPGRARPVPKIVQLAAEFPSLRVLDNLLALDSFVRPEGVQAFRSTGSLALLPKLVQRLSFVQRIYCLPPDNPAVRRQLDQWKAELGPVIAFLSAGERLVVHALPHYALYELASMVARRAKGTDRLKDKLDGMLEALLGRPSWSSQGVGRARLALSARSTTSHLSHDLHYYKAKFFPRLARSMLNVCSEHLRLKSPRVLDPFVGSGTTLLEAASMRMPAVGLDLDPLSVLISQTKLAVADLDPVMLEEAQQRVAVQLAASPLESGSIQFPAWLTKNRKMTAEWADILSGEISWLRAVVATGHPQATPLLRVLVSDAIARRVRMRFLGTGVGRFSLSFAKTTAPAIFLRSLRRYVQVTLVFQWLNETTGLNLAPAQVWEGDARALPQDIGKFDLVLTSPPYLPASSGRESYAQARALSLIALEMRDANSLDSLVDRSVGSMNGGRGELDDLNLAERDLVTWLQKDDLRSIKAEPTARYFVDMGQALQEMYRALRPGGLAVVVSGKQSTFYNFSTRQALYVVPAADMLAQRAEEAGFEVQALHHLQLQKANRNARPRSLDDYYETLIMLRRPG